MIRFFKACSISFLSLICFGTEIRAQNELDSLLNVLPSLTGEKRVDVLNLTGNYLSTIEVTRADSFLVEAYELSSDLDYKKGQVENLLFRGTLYNVQDLLFEADSTSKLALKAAQNSEDSRLLSRAYILMGSLNQRKQRFDLAIEYYLKGIEYAELSGDVDGQIVNLMNIGLINQQLGNLNLADNYFDQALKVALKNNMKFRLAELYLNKAVLEYFKGNLNSSISLNNRALEYFKNFGDKYRAARVYQNLGFAENLLGKRERANQFYDSALVLYEESNFVIGIADVSYNLAQIAIEDGKYQRALALVKLVNEKAEIYENPELRLRGAELEALIYENQGNANQALKSLKNVLLLRDSVNKLNNKARIDDLITRYDVEKREKELNIRQQRIALLSRDNKLLELRQLLYAAIITLSVLLALLIYFRSRAKLRESKAREGQASAEAKAEKLLNEKLELDLKNKSSELEEYTSRLSAQNRMISTFRDRISELERLETIQKKEIQDDSNFVEKADHDLLSWREFRMKFDVVYPNFVENISKLDTALSPRELDLCILSKINLSISEMSSILDLNYETVKKGLQRVSKKMGYANTDEFRKSIITY